MAKPRGRGQSPTVHQTYTSPVSIKRPVQRDAYRIASDVQSLLTLNQTQTLNAVRSIFQQIEDRRVFHPEPYKPFRTIRGRQFARISDDKVKGAVNVLRFANPRNVIHCLRRKVRKEVLHAIRKTGGNTSKRKRMRTRHSHISC